MFEQGIKLDDFLRWLIFYDSVSDDHLLSREYSFEPLSGVKLLCNIGSIINDKEYIYIKSHKSSKNNDKTEHSLMRLICWLYTYYQ